MNVTLNSKQYTLGAPLTLAEFIGKVGINADGIAIAVDHKVIPRSQWNGFMLEDGAKLIIIKAVCGG